jgi:tRNA threonylcarbamoyladenosine biosynthesis protein TsaE
MKKLKTWQSASIEDSKQIANELSQLFKKGHIIFLEGTLGSGKTFLVQNICANWNVTDDVTSPTFTIIQNYSGDYPINHLDLYRIEEQNELDQLGWEDMLYSDAVTFVEWPEKIENYVDHFYKISINMNNTNRRIELFEK